MNFAEGNGAMTIAMRLLDTSCSRGTLTAALVASCFRGDLPPDDTIYEEIFLICVCSVSWGVGTIVMSEVWAIVGERESTEMSG